MGTVFIICANAGLKIVCPVSFSFYVSYCKIYNGIPPASKIHRKRSSMLGLNKMETFIEIDLVFLFVTQIRHNCPEHQQWTKHTEMEFLWQDRFESVLFEYIIFAVVQCIDAGFLTWSKIQLIYVVPRRKSHRNSPFPLP